MFLSELMGKEILSGKTAKGYCKGVGISLKTYAVKYLLCASTPTAEADFCISASAITQIGEGVTLSQMRPLFPKSCAKLFPNKPIYAFDGTYLGKIADVLLQDLVATELYTEQNAIYPTSAIAACQDAVILKREQPFPLGQRIPAPYLSLFTDKKDGLITKSTLRTAIGHGKLIRLTLSLPPFRISLLH